jgi:hypothetical protein
MKNFIALAYALVFFYGASAQDKHFKQQLALGYKGKFIPGIRYYDSGFNFIVIGDWGRSGEYYQKDVAEQMSYAAVSLNPAFIISTGDNFYPYGVASVHDPLWKSSYEDIYHQFSLHCEWHPVLGNHDYSGNPDAEVEYSKVSRRWMMPARYYARKFMINNDPQQQVLIVFMDTNPFIKKYHSNPYYGPKVATQDTAAQRRWMDSVLNDNTVKWKFVAGHHPLFSGGGRKDAPETADMHDAFHWFFEKHKVDAYISGHEHHLEHIKPAGTAHYFISGGGSETRHVAKHPDGGKFASGSHGFMTFSLFRNKMLVQAIDHLGKILYSTEIKK